MSPNDVLNAAKAGNERFQSGKHASRDALKDQKTTASGQHPEAVVLSCMDSRVAPEIIMDLGIGDFFDVRVAGNVISDDVLGSMEYACKEDGSKLILVLGHTGCGAIKGAIDNLQLGHLSNLLAKIRPAIQKTVFDGERSSNNPAFVEAVSRTNVLLTIEGIRQQSPVLEELESQRAIKIAGAMYNLATAKIDFMS
jgi:carbonic anhydrase